jgi:prolyl-tRNA synthetase
MLDVYADFVENWMALPVIKGEKTAAERFPGAVATYSIEAMMQDRKALQAGTSHFLGQNFSRAQQIKFQDAQGGESYAWTTSWGMSTRLVGALIMAHSDDDGLVVPPRLAPRHAVILPIYRSDEDRASVLPYCEQLKKDLEKIEFAGDRLRVQIDDRDLRGGEKNWQHVKRGVPLRLEIGPKDLAKDSVFMGRRDTGEKKSITRAELLANVATLLEEIQTGLFQRAKQLRDANIRSFTNLDEFKAWFKPENEERPEIHGGFALCHFVDEPAVNDLLKEMKLSVRCVPLDGGNTPGTCLFTGKPTHLRGIIAKAY